MNRWAPIPDRQPGEVLSEITYRAEMEGERNTGRLRAEFRHRDNRVWQARIIPLPPGDAQTHISGHTHVVNLDSAGCRPVRFVARDVNRARQTIQRFANLHIELYERLVADARGTSSHPRSDNIGVFRMQVVKQVRQPGGRTETQRYDVEGIGRHDGDCIVVFPLSSDLEAILEECCARGCLPLVSAGVNALHPDRFNRGVLDTAAVDPVDQAVVDAAVLRGFDDDVDTAIAGLRDGSYTIPQPRAREERDLDIFGGNS